MNILLKIPNINLSSSEKSQKKVLEESTLITNDNKSHIGKQHISDNSDPKIKDMYKFKTTDGWFFFVNIIFLLMLIFHDNTIIRAIKNEMILYIISISLGLIGVAGSLIQETSISDLKKWAIESFNTHKQNISSSVKTRDVNSVVHAITKPIQDDKIQKFHMYFVLIYLSIFLIGTLFARDGLFLSIIFNVLLRIIIIMFKKNQKNEKNNKLVPESAFSILEDTLCLGFIIVAILFSMALRMLSFISFAIAVSLYVLLILAMLIGTFFILEKIGGFKLFNLPFQSNSQQYPQESLNSSKQEHTI